MKIHRVKNGDTLFGIARSYGVPATKILSDNNLSGDRLTPGEELLILTPTKTITVRGSDTLDALATRFSTKVQKLLANNPAICAKGKIAPGQLITVKHDAPSLGTAAAIGYYTKGTTYENLTRSLPYITYLCVDCAILSNREIKLTFSPQSVTDIALSHGKVPLLCVRATEPLGDIQDSDTMDRLIEGMISLSRSKGFSGIVLSSECSVPYLDFLIRARKRFIGCDMLLFVETDISCDGEAAEIADGAVFFPGGTSITSACAEISEYAQRCESSKIFVHLTSYATAKERSIPISEAKNLCYRNGKSITTDENTLLSSFEYNRYIRGIGENLSVSFPSLQYIAREMECLSELGYMGIGIDVDSAPVPIFSMFNALFTRADYT